MKKIIALTADEVQKMLRDMKSDNRWSHKQIDNICGAPRGSSCRMANGHGTNKHILLAMGIRKEIVFTYIDDEKE